MNRWNVIILAGCLMMGTGCGRQAHAVHPGAINAFDSYSYDTLLVAQAAIEQAKTEVAKHLNAKRPLNQAIASFNIAEASYVAYHASAGTLDTADLQKALRELTVALAQMHAAFGGKQ